MVRDHLIDMTACTKTGPEDRGQPKSEILPESEQPDDAKAETGKTDFRLEWAIRPAD